MAATFEQLEAVPGFSVPVHRSLSEPILLGGAPRTFAILNGTLAGAIGLGLQLWIAGIAIGLLGHAMAVWAARRDPLFVETGRRHLRLPGHFEV
ncbi:VirB3 family type IV secretion system protein [Manganibacter manganicus]|uniref:Conjugal transfer protein n=1 Tax=Manganibacter manganicus TaxID=1873176 RepID=A0A1V8RU61_9HYPH|nr:VirB3 family type IV secretion system protein [Pseudaminobacter manganicus]OQM76722.1 conjugal transfer protein [Pseudaminobacter manganicus]